MEKNYIVIRDEALSQNFEDRYIILDKETGEVLDDAQGYGYKSKQKAMAAWHYKNRDKSKDAEKKRRYRKIKKWMKDHEDFVEAMDTYSFEIWKGSWGPDAKFDAKLVKEMLEQFSLEVDFPARDLLYVWENYSKIK